MYVCRTFGVEVVKVLCPLINGPAETFYEFFFKSKLFS
jgi:hypothetical protein